MAWPIHTFIEFATSNSQSKDGKLWYPAKPHPAPFLWRLADAIQVLKGEAEAVIWRPPLRRDDDKCQHNWEHGQHGSCQEDTIAFQACSICGQVRPYPPKEKDPTGEAGP